MRRSLVRILIVGAVLLPFALLYLGMNQVEYPKWADDAFNRTCYELGGAYATISILPPQNKYNLICTVLLGE
jgi:hypothetical protein